MRWMGRSYFESRGEQSEALLLVGPDEREQTKSTVAVADIERCDVACSTGSHARGHRKFERLGPAVGHAHAACWVPVGTREALVPVTVPVREQPRRSADLEHVERKLCRSGNLCKRRQQRSTATDFVRLHRTSECFGDLAAVLRDDRKECVRIDGRAIATRGGVARR